MRYLSIQRAVAFVFGVLIGSGSYAAERRFTVEDSIELSTFVYPGPQYLPAPRVTFSPDRKHFITVTTRGNLTTGKRDATMWLFDSDAVRSYVEGRQTADFAKAKPLARIASASSRDVLSGWRWSADSKNVLFLGTDDDGAERLYRISLAGGDPVPLSRADQDVSRFDERNGSIVYLAHAPIRAGEIYQAGGPTLPDMEVGTGKDVYSLVFPNWFETISRTSKDELWKLDADKPVVVLNADRKSPVRIKDSKLILSPDGRQAVVTTFKKRVPKSWERYQSMISTPVKPFVADTPETEGETGFFRPKQYALMDLSNGETSLLVDSPVVTMSEQYNQVSASWNADGTQVALVAAYPKLDDSAAGNTDKPVLPCALAVVNIRTKGFACVQAAVTIDSAKHPYGERPQMIDLQWRNADRELIATYITPNRPTQKIVTVFALEAGKWTQGNTSTPAGDGLAVEVRESIDEPPVLVASVNGSSPKPLFDPNPQLKDIALGHAVPYQWKDADGDIWTGALVTPPNFSKNRRYPLVLQTHGLDPSQFLVDGPSATAFAARALAARDIVVLQIKEPNKNHDTFKESESGAAGYRAAIKQLASEGVIDPTKVGIVAWSHYGPYAMQGLIDEPQTYAAATFAEASYNSYTEYLNNVDYMGGETRVQYFAAQIGAKPFGAGLKNWLDRSAGFNTERVCTPILFQRNNPSGLIYAWNSYAALRAQHKPVDLFYIRNDEHVLIKPLHRLAEQGMNVDWYDFWLNNHKDPNPAKAAQYKRWDALQAMPRCGDSAAQPSAGS